MIREPQARLHGTVRVPGDKSISHRALLFGALAEGRTEIEGLSNGADVRSTAACLRALGVTVFPKGGGGMLVVGGQWTPPSIPLDCGNSGTTLRLLMGCLAGRAFETTLTGDESLRSRPMERVAQPLRAMGATVTTSGGKAPVLVTGGALHGIDFELTVPSAQVKTAVLLAGLRAKGVTRLTGRLEGRDHTERLLPRFGVSLDVGTGSIVLPGEQRLQGTSVTVPGDISSAAFFIAAACLVRDGRIALPNVLLNPTRDGFLRVVERMGAMVSRRVDETDPEPVGTLVAESSTLRGTTILPEEVPSLIDELPLLAVLATQAEGVTEVRGAEELRVKESDRIDAMGEGLLAMGARFTALADGFRIEGPTPLRGARVRSHGDHRVAMALAVAALVAKGPTEIEGADVASVSYPAFFTALEEMARG